MFNRYKKGFTLMELMVVIAIIAILLGLILTNINKQQKKSRDNVRIADIQKIRLALDHYRLACGEFPSHLALDVKNGCPHGVSFRDFINEIPKSPAYSAGSYKFSGPESEYFYAGLSTTTNGKCYEYHIATQLEYGAKNDFSNGEQKQFLETDHDYEQFQGDYNRSCLDAHEDFQFGENDAYGLYDFRSTKHENL